MSLRIENPQAYWALVPLVLFLIWMLRRARHYPASFSVRRFFLLSLAFIACIVGFSRPQLGEYASSQSGRRANLFLALDISKSMLAEDVSPSRLGFMAAFCRKLLQQIPGIRVAIFPFARDGYLQMPLSNDLDAAGDLLSSLSTSMTTSQGTDLSATLETLLETIGKMERATTESGGEWAPTQVLLASDGEAHKPLNESVAQKFRARHIPIFTLGVGTTAGGFIPVENRFGSSRENLRDNEGRTVRTRLEPESLKKIARASGGDYFTSRFEEVYVLAARMSQSMSLGTLSFTFQAKNELYPYLFALALCLLALELAFGRWQYVLRLWPLFFLLLHAAAPPIYADNDNSKSPEAQAIESYNQGIADLGRGNLQRAMELFSDSAGITKDKTLQKKALYNLGNSMLRIKDPAQALQAYQQAMDIDTGSKRFDRDTNRKISENITLAVQMEEERRKQRQQQKPDDEGDGDQKQQGTDPKGPKKDFAPQFFDEAQKKKIFDLISSEEQQTLQRLQDRKNRKNTPQMNGKEW